VKRRLEALEKLQEEREKLYEQFSVRGSAAIQSGW
jgi:hypothetical protein